MLSRCVLHYIHHHHMPGSPRFPVSTLFNNPFAGTKREVLVWGDLTLTYMCSGAWCGSPSPYLSVVPLHVPHGICRSSTRLLVLTCPAPLMSMLYSPTDAYLFSTLLMMSCWASTHTRKIPDVEAGTRRVTSDLLGRPLTCCGLHGAWYHSLAPETPTLAKWDWVFCSAMSRNSS